MSAQKMFFDKNGKEFNVFELYEKMDETANNLLEMDETSKNLFKRLAELDTKLDSLDYKLWEILKVAKAFAEAQNLKID